MPDSLMTPGVNGLTLEKGTGGWQVILSGRWSVDHPLPDLTSCLDRLAADPAPVLVRADRLEGWDTALVVVLMRLCEAGPDRLPDLSALPQGLQRLTKLATAVPERSGTGRKPPVTGLFTSTGALAIERWRSFLDLLDFIGDATMALGSFLAGKARLRSEDFWLAVEAAGVRALPIVGIIALLIGMIFAFVGAVQLQQFGADIYVANLVAVAMSREMGAVMTGIVLAGRTGAAFAAQISAMQGNEEVDALTTLGISPMQFLVVPRMLALILMMPLLTLYADLMGLLGGMIVAAGMLNVTVPGYLIQTTVAIGLGDVVVGLGKSLFFGALVALAGCRAGMRAGRSAAAVGDAATRAVVSGILYIIICDAFFAVALHLLKL
jgi:phospholipid/cholesterol/gamma-HCH transport system permease protein